MLYLLIGILILVLAVLVIALVQKSRGEDPTEVAKNPPIECCGAHEVCEVDSLLNADAKVVYYDDEELDRFRGRDPKSYNDEEIEEFQDVLLTMDQSEVPAWLRSLTLRCVDLPSVVKEEALLIVDELRQMRQQSLTTT